jgi:hypothetical protein
VYRDDILKYEKVMAIQPLTGHIFLEIKKGMSVPDFPFYSNNILPVNTCKSHDSTIIRSWPYFYFFILAKFVKVPQLFMSTTITGRTLRSTAAKNRLILLGISSYSLLNWLELRLVRS